MIKINFANREYDLPWDRPFIESMVVAIIALVIPYSLKYPISEIFCIGAVVFYLALPPRRNRLGFALNPSARRALLYIALIFVSLNVFAFIIIQDVKFEAHMENDPTSVVDFSLDNPIFKEWRPDYRFGQAVQTGSLSETLNTYKKQLYLFGVLAPIYESVFIFGILFPALWKRYSYPRAILITTTVFLFIHFPRLDWSGFFDYSIFTLISIFIFAKTKSLYPLILLHAFFNLTISAFGVYLQWELQTVYTNLLP